MSRDEIRSRIPVLQAWLEQKAIQFRDTRLGSPEWFDSTSETPPDIFNEAIEWRIKPEPPKPREWWVVTSHIHSDNGIAYYDRLVAVTEAGIHHPPKQVVHVREVLSSEPEPFSIPTRHGACTPPQPKDPAAPPDQQP